MNQDFSELIQHLDQKFAKLGKDIQVVRNEVVQNRKDIQWNRKDIQVVRNEVIQNRKNIQVVTDEVIRNRGEIVDMKERMATKVEVNKLLNAVDAYMKQGEDYRQEMLMLAHKVDRHEKWIKQIADKLGVKLEH